MGILKVDAGIVWGVKAGIFGALSISYHSIFGNSGKKWLSSELDIARLLALLLKLGTNRDSWHESPRRDQRKRRYVSMKQVVSITVYV